MGSDRKDYRFETDEGAPRWQTSFEGARSCSSTTSCSCPTMRRAARRRLLLKLERSGDKSLRLAFA